MSARALNGRTGQDQAQDWPGARSPKQSRRNAQNKRLPDAAFCRRTTLETAASADQGAGQCFCKRREKQSDSQEPGKQASRRSVRPDSGEPPNVRRMPLRWLRVKTSAPCRQAAAGPSGETAGRRERTRRAIPEVCTGSGSSGRRQQKPKGISAWYSTIPFARVLELGYALLPYFL